MPNYEHLFAVPVRHFLLNVNQAIPETNIGQVSVLTSETKQVVLLPYVEEKAIVKLNDNGLYICLPNNQFKPAHLYDSTKKSYARFIQKTFVKNGEPDWFEDEYTVDKNTLTKTNYTNLKYIYDTLI